MIEDDIVANRHRLKAVALKVTRDINAVDDLVQETLVRALDGLHTFEPGTNLTAWLVTIMKNTYRSTWRRGKRFDNYLERTIGDGSINGAQEDTIDLKLSLMKINALPPHMKDAMEMIAILGYSYEEVAEITDVPVGTIKSRLFRAREKIIA
jgi:RNA polymerase sigma-70 factor, ECF subfamily